MSFVEEDNCLTSSFPPWQLTMARLKCCFVCCISRWAAHLGLDENEASWGRALRDTGKASINRDRSTDWKPSKWHPHTQGQSVLLSGMGFALLAHANVFHFRSMVQLRWARNRTSRDMRILLHSNTAEGVPPLLAFARRLLLTRPQDGHEPPPDVVLASRDDAELPGEEALGQWRELQRRWPSPSLRPRKRGRDGRPSAATDATPPRWFLQNSLSLQRASGLHSLPIGVDAANELSSFLEKHSRGREASPVHRPTLLLCCCMQTRSDGDGHGSTRLPALRTLAYNGFPECAMGSGGRNSSSGSSASSASSGSSASSASSGSSASSASGSRLSPRDYYEALVRSKFVLAPRGYGRDTFRVWEALTLGSVPVMRRLSREASAEYEKYDGLPIVWVDEWEQVTPSLLRTRWEELMAAPRRARREALPSGLRDLAGRPSPPHGGKAEREDGDRTGIDMRRAFFPFWLSRLMRD